MSAYREFDDLAGAGDAMQDISVGRPLLEIIVVSYGEPDLVRACLASICRYPTSKGPSRVHLVDNHSPVDVVGMVQREFPDVQVWPLFENLGFSAANNEALRATSAPWLLLLNPDAELRAGVLDHMLDLTEAQPTIGVAGCRLEQLDGTFDHAAKRSFPTPTAALAHFTSLGRRSDAVGRLAQYRAVEVGEYELGDVDAVNGAFMLVRREAMKEVGFLDTGYWMYGEDLDWCRRFKLAGWRVVYDGRVTATHVKGGTAGARRAAPQNIAFHRAMGRFYRRFDAGRNPVIDALVYSAIVAKLALSLVWNWFVALRHS